MLEISEKFKLWQLECSTLWAVETRVWSFQWTNNNELTDNVANNHEQLKDASNKHFIPSQDVRQTEHDMVKELTFCQQDGLGQRKHRVCWDALYLDFMVLYLILSSFLSQFSSLFFKEYWKMVMDMSTGHHMYWNKQQQVVFTSSMLHWFHVRHNMLLLPWRGEMNF